MLLLFDVVASHAPTAYTHWLVGAEPEDLARIKIPSLLRFGDRYRVTLAMAGRGVGWP